MHTLLFILFLPVICMSIFLGPAIVKMHRMEKCGEDGPETFVNFSVKSFNRTHQGVDAYAIIPNDLGEDTEMNVTVSKWGDGGWKPHVFDMYETNICEFFMKYSKEKIDAVLRSLGQPEKCPFSSGTYQVANYIYNGIVSVPIMYGEFKVEVLVTQRGVPMTCIRVFARSDPQKKFG